MKQYIVCDEDGELRGFHTRKEALAFIGDNEWTIKVKKRKKLSYADYLALCGECLF